ncbi:unnamed protein product [Caenorhabditis angaria]|uniref:Zinc finger PHD-type domain-containing protein n=1 Tax=Caenorhabditis angaria TaxID=860376 RepID=A0A9P1IYQ5_9PELO|nr:unnamed protein product [Caenorhabditis angaria]
MGRTPTRKAKQKELAIKIGERNGKEFKKLQEDHAIMVEKMKIEKEELKNEILVKSTLIEILENDNKNKDKIIEELKNKIKILEYEFRIAEHSKDSFGISLSENKEKLENFENENKLLKRTLKAEEQKMKSKVSSLELEIKILKSDKDKSEGKCKELKKSFHKNSGLNFSGKFGYKPYNSLPKNKEKDLRHAYYFEMALDITKEINLKPFFGGFNRWLAVFHPECSLKLTVSDFFHMRNRFRWTWYEMQNFKRLFKLLFNFDPYPSLNKLRDFEELFNLIKYYSIRTEPSLTKNKKTSLVCECTDLQSAIDYRYTRMAQYDCLTFENPDQPARITYIGDKGGGSTKWWIIFWDIIKSNSCKGLFCIGIFDGSDKQKEMTFYFPTLIDQIKKLKFITYKDKFGNTIKRRVEPFVAGDCMYLYAIYGHKGPNASENCMICYHKNDKTKLTGLNIGNWNIHVKLVMRTIQDYKNDAVNGENSVNKNSTCIFEEVEVDHTVPAVMHVKMGVVDPLTIHALKLDATTPEELDVIEKRLEESSAIELLTTKIGDVHEEVNEFDEDGEILNDCLIILDNSRRTGAKCSSELKCSKYCYVPDLVKMRDGYTSHGSVECPKCHDIFHMECIGILDKRKRTELLYGIEIFECYKCRNMSYENIYGELKQDREFVLKETIEIGKVQETLQKSVKKLKDSEKGMYQEKLEEFFNEIGAQRQAYYTKSFNGNHMHLLLQEENVEKLFEIFPDSNFTRSLKYIMLRLSKIETYSSATYLTEFEIQDLKNNIYNMVLEMKKVYPEKSVTPKLHIMVQHFPVFADKYKTLGKTSEQGAEAQHAEINIMNRDLSAIKDLVKKGHALMKKLFFMNETSDSGFYDK